MVPSVKVEELEEQLHTTNLTLSASASQELPRFIGSSLFSLAEDLGSLEGCEG